MSNSGNVIRSEPALVGHVLAVAAILVAAFGVHVTRSQAAAIATIAVALAAIWTAVEARPVSVPILAGAMSTAIVAAAAWGLKFDPALIATVTTAVATLVSLIFRVHVTPVVRAVVTPVAAARPIA